MGDILKAIILNSGIGSRLKEYTRDKPKSMVKITDKDTICSKAIKTLLNFDINEFIITTGYLDTILKEYIKETFPDVNFTFVYNDRYDTTNYIKSLDNITNDFDDDILLLHGDLIFDKDVVELLLLQDESSVVVDSSIVIPEKDFKAQVVEGKVKLISVNYFGEDAKSCQPLYKLSNTDWKVWKEKINNYCNNNKTNVYAEEALNELLDDEILLKAVDIEGFACFEIDTVEELEHYRKYGEQL